MRFDVLTIFPGMFTAFTQESVIGRAINLKKVIEINVINIRDFSKNKHRKVDDAPYGGGPGMIMTFQPVYDAYRSIVDGLDYKPKVIYMSPQGQVLTQDLAKKLAEEKHLVILCGHYEGIDERIIEEIVDEEISIGDYIVTGGELPAMVLMDCVARMVPGVLPRDECFLEESFMDGLLEYPQYTRPEEIMGRRVPEILLSGHHENIARWRREQALLRTAEKRPDLYKKYLERIKKGQNSHIDT